MKKLDERTPWEKEWASAFEDASLPPSENVWHSIDGELANKEAKKYRKRAFFFQWAAAASFLLACCSIAFMLLQNSPLQQGQELARQDAQKETREDAREDSLQEKQEDKWQNSIAQEAGPDAADAPAAGGLAGTGSAADRNSEQMAEHAGSQGVAIAQNSKATAKGTEPAPTSAVGAGKEGTGKTEQQLAVNETRQAGNTAVGGIKEAGDSSQSQSSALAGLTNEDGAGAGEDNARLAAWLPQNIRSLPIELSEEKTPAPVEARIRKVWMASHMLKKSKEASTPRYLLGANIASNYFNPNFQENTPAFASFAAESAKPVKGNLMSASNMDNWQEEQQINQPSVNAGIQAAGWIGKKWVLQGGVQYGNYRSTTMAGSFMDPATAQAYPLHFANFSPDKMQRVNAGSRMAAPVSAINTFEFISVPVKIGYLVIDKKVGLMLSPGISSEIFLRNQLADANNQLSTFTIYGGEDAPFNRLHFRGIMGAQVFYKLSDHYMISLEPNYQHSITNFNKEGAMFQSRPSNLGLSAGFRYIIR